MPRSRSAVAPDPALESAIVDFLGRAQRPVRTTEVTAVISANWGKRVEDSRVDRILRGLRAAGRITRTADRIVALLPPSASPTGRPRL